MYFGEELRKKTDKKHDKKRHAFSRAPGSLIAAVVGVSICISRIVHCFLATVF